jgi:hypothetical protein
MTLKNIQYGRAENLSPEIRKKYGLPESGPIILETIYEEDKDGN